MSTATTTRYVSSDVDDDFEDFFRDSSEYERMENLKEKILGLVAEDNKDGLVRLLRSPPGTFFGDIDKTGSQLSIFILCQCICSDAINCATAVVKGETGLTPCLNEPGFLPLHAAAYSLSPKMTRYFLKLGIPANARAPADSKDGPLLLPVDDALTSIRRRIFWEERQSLYKLIVKLTGEIMYNPIRTVILLMNELSDSEISELICRYATEGKVIDLATLLIGLSEKQDFLVDNLCVPSNSPSGDKLTLRQHIVNQIVMLENELGKSVGMENIRLSKFKERKKSMMPTLMLLEIFLRAQDGISKVVKSLKPSRPDHSVPDTIARVLEGSGFKLTSRDAAYCWKLLAVIPFFRRLLDPRRRNKGFQNGGQYQQSDELPDAVRKYFPSGLPQLNSFATVAEYGWDKTDPNRDKLLAAVEKLSFVIYTSYWTPNQSIFKLITVLCIPKMKQKLEAITFFAQSIEKMNEIAFYYTREGKLIELAIILMVAKEKVRDPLVLQIKSSDSARSMTLEQFINSELAQAVDLEYRLIGRTTEQEKELSGLCKQRKAAMMSALTLLEVFEKADTLRSYLSTKKGNVQKEQVIKDVSKLLLEAGFKLKCKDIEVGDLDESPKSVDLEKLDEAMQGLKKNAKTRRKRGSERQDSRTLSYLLPCGFVEKYGAYGRPDYMKNFLFLRYPRECYVLSNAAQPYRALWSSKAYCTTSLKALEFQKQRDAFRGLNWLMQKYPPNKQLASVALAIRKITKYA